MRNSVRSAALALWFGTLAAAPFAAVEHPQKQLSSHRCRIASNPELPPDTQAVSAPACQVGEGPEPIDAASRWGDDIGEGALSLDALLQLLTPLNHALRLSLESKHGQLETPAPTP